MSRAQNTTGGVKSAAAVLNTMDKTQRLNILNKLDERAPDLVRSIRMKMFTFEDLATLDNRQLAKILNGVETNTVAVALSAANENLRNKLLGALSKRASDNILDEISNLGRVTLREIERSQDMVIDVVRTLEAEGTITLDTGGQ